MVRLEADHLRRVGQTSGPRRFRLSARVPSRTGPPRRRSSPPAGSSAAIRGRSVTSDHTFAGGAATSMDVLELCRQVRHARHNGRAAGRVTPRPACPTSRAARPWPPPGPSALRPAAAPAGTRYAAPTSRPGPMPRISMIWLPSRSGRIAASSSCSEQPGDPLLEVVVRAPQPLGLALVAGGAVGAGQDVQPLELVAGVADVAAYGGVGPLAVAVAVEAQVQLDQLRRPRRSRRWRSAAPASACGSASRRPRRGGGR